jgi:hypothetical protein
LEPGVQAFFCKFCAASVLLMWFSIVSFSVVHHTQKFVPWLYWWTYAITQLTVLLSISLWIWSTYERITHHADEVKAFEHFVVIGQVLTVVAPSLITLTKGDLEGFYYYTIGFFPYLITMATYIMFPFYCTARIWDLTWGNRPEDMDTDEAQDRQTVMEDVQEQVGAAPRCVHRLPPHGARATTCAPVAPPPSDFHRGCASSTTPRAGDGALASPRPPRPGACAPGSLAPAGAH